MQDKIAGEGNEIKGKVKEEVGKLGGDKSTEWSGKADQVKGHIKEGIGDVKNEVNKDV